MQRRDLPEGWDRNLPVFAADAKGIAGRDASGKVLNVLAQSIPWFLGGSADLGPSNKTTLTYEGAGHFQAGTPGDVIRTTAGFYKVESVPQKQVEAKAIVNPASLAGLVALIYLMVKAVKAHSTTQASGAVEVFGIYWGMVDAVWIFLFPLLYLL